MLCVQVFGLASLLSPTGQGHGYGLGGGGEVKLAAASASEDARVRLNTAGLLARLRRLQLLALCHSCALMAATITVLESWLEAGGGQAQGLVTRAAVYPATAALALVAGLASQLHYSAVSRSQQEAAISPPASPSTPMRPDPSLRVEDETRPPPPPLYPALPSAPAPDPPYNPSYLGAQQHLLVAGPGNTRCSNTSCVTCTKMVEGPWVRSTVTGGWKLELSTGLHEILLCPEQATTIAFSLLTTL